MPPKEVEVYRIVNNANELDTAWCGMHDMVRLKHCRGGEVKEAWSGKGEVTPPRQGRHVGTVWRHHDRVLQKSESKFSTTICVCTISPKLVSLSRHTKEASAL